MPKLSAMELRVGVFQDQLSYLSELTQFEYCPTLSTDNLHNNQMLLEYLIVCNLLKEKFSPLKIKFVGYPVVTRLLDGLEKGDVDISGFGVWSGEADSNQLLLSGPLLAKREFTKGLYTLENTRKRVTNELNGNITSLVAVSNKNWTYDWQQLACSGMQLFHVDRYEQMFRILHKKRADVLPLAFGSADDLSHVEFGVKLFPIEGFKLVIPDSNHFLISKNRANHQQLLSILNEGLNKLREEVVLQRLYQEIGVLNGKTKEWQSICFQ